MRRTLFILLLMLAFSHAAASAVDEVQERRIRSGLRLFRAVLAADKDIASKTDSAGKLLLLVVYADDRKLAESFAAELEQLGKGDKRGTVRKLPIDVQVSNDLSLKPFQNQVPAGIYVVEKLYDDDVNRLVRYGVENHVIVYSPFEGDVNKGILVGLAIETRVRPYINLHTMRESRIRIKQFFLKVAKHYEP